MSNLEYVMKYNIQYMYVYFIFYILSILIIYNLWFKLLNIQMLKVIFINLSILSMIPEISYMIWPMATFCLQISKLKNR